MSKSYFNDVREIIDNLAEDEELMFEERLILLRLVTSHIAKVANELEDELDKVERGQEI